MSLFRFDRKRQQHQNVDTESIYNAISHQTKKMDSILEPIKRIVKKEGARKTLNSLLLWKWHYCCHFCLRFLLLR